MALESTSTSSCAQYVGLQYRNAAGGLVELRAGNVCQTGSAVTIETVCRPAGADSLLPSALLAPFPLSCHSCPVRFLDPPPMEESWFIPRRAPRDVTPEAR